MSALDLKGRMLSTTRVRARSSDFSAMSAQLAAMARQMPSAVQGMPVILEAEEAVDLAQFIAAVREVGMQPIGVSGEALAESAVHHGLAVLPPDSGSGARAPRRAAAPEVEPPPPSPEPVAEPAPVPAPAARTTRLVDSPVRGGQQIYAAGSDLVVLSQVGAGAEVLADGSIHIYGRLAGRAIAGAQGNADARIYCSRFEPELVAIAGVYAVAEQLQGEWLGKPAQVCLRDGKLCVERLD